MTRQISRAESWERAYEAFQDINFTGFDYYTIKSGMIDYLKLHYPENFNDFIESSELIAFIEVFAYAAEVLAYRFDMNAHENFISVAERKQSVLRLAKLVSYTASRNLPLRGLVKITSVTTTETVVDSHGINLAGRKINWNDPNNSNWKEQFLFVIDKILTQPFGSVLPKDRIQVDDIVFEHYTLQNSNTSTTSIPFSVSASGKTIPMEIVPVALDSSGPFERRPESNSNFSLVYVSDGIGDSSDFTGFFFFVKQGKLQMTTRQFDGTTPNQTVNLDIPNINDIDVWVNQVYPDTGVLIRERSLDNLGKETGYQGEWEQVDTSNSRNILFNNNSKRNKYEIETLEQDKIKIIFGDGEFADIPNGSFDIWYRTSESDVVIVPKSEVVNKSSSFKYASFDNLPQVFSFTYSLTAPLANNAPSEDIESVRRLAPSMYYTQDRMVNAADYNTFMLQDPSILKLKAVNRTFVGDSKYIAWHDPSETYENVKFFGDDLRLYFQENSSNVAVPLGTSTSEVVDNYIQPLLGKHSVRTNNLNNNINYTRITFYPTERSSIIVSINDALETNGNAFPIKIALIPKTTKAYVGFIFNDTVTDNTNLNDANIISPSSLLPLTVKIDGTEYNIDVLGADIDSISDPSVITMDTLVDGLNYSFVSNAVPATVFRQGNVIYFQSTIIGLASTMEVFDFSLFTLFGGYFVKVSTSVNGIQSDTWKAYSYDTPLLSVHSFEVSTTATYEWTLNYNELLLVSESPTTRFWYNNSGVLVNADTLNVDSDKVVILAANINRDRDGILSEKIELAVEGSIIQDANENLGLPEINKLVLSTTDTTGDLQPDDILLRNQLFDKTETVEQGGVSNIGTFGDYKIYELPTSYDIGFREMEVLSQDNRLLSGLDYYECDVTGNLVTVTSIPTESVYVAVKNTFIDTDLEFRHIDYVYYQRATEADEFVYVGDVNVSRTIKEQWLADSTVASTDKKTTRYRGRSDLNFAWFYVTPNYNLIDPATSNIHDMFIITRGFYQVFQQWLRDEGEEPQPPSPYQLRTSYGHLVQNKMLSDTVLLYSGKIKILFGKKAPTELQAKIKVVKSSVSKKTDNEIKTVIVDTIRDYFNINFWEFGETFSFSELSAVIHSKLSNDIKSVVLTPNYTQNNFGDMYEVMAREDEILQAHVTTDDIEIVSSLSAKTLKQYPY